MSYSDDMEAIKRREKLSSKRSWLIEKDGDVFDDFLSEEDAQEKVEKYINNDAGVFVMRKMTCEEMGL